MAAAFAPCTPAEWKREIFEEVLDPTLEGTVQNEPTTLESSPCRFSSSKAP